MTINKIALSALTAAIVTTTAFAAGTLAVQGGVNTVSSELLSVQAVDVNISNNLQYTNGMTAASATEPGFELEFAGLTPVVAATNDIQIKDENNITVATFDRVQGSSIIFNTVATTVVNRSAVYTVSSEANATTLAANTLQLTLPINTTSANAKLILYSNSGDSTLDTATDAIITPATQFTLSVSTLLNAQIDASSGFKNFTTTASTTTKDVFGYTFRNKNTLDFPATLTNLTVNLVADQNLSTYKISVPNNPVATAVNGGVASAMSSVLTDFNVTHVLAVDANTSASYASTLTTSAVGAMKVTNFTATGDVQFTGGSKNLLNSVNAGSWTIFGYTAQIPNVAGLETHETTLKFTNRSTLSTNIFFTLVDPDGTIATLDSVTNTTLAALPANTTGTYKATALLALVTDVNFDKTGSFSVEVAIPTTPSSVYGMASFKNITLGQFKDLPVYNSSTLAY